MEEEDLARQIRRSSRLALIIIVLVVSFISAVLILGTILAAQVDGGGPYKMYKAIGQL